MSTFLLNKRNVQFRSINERNVTIPRHIYQYVEEIIGGDVSHECLNVSTLEYLICATHVHDYCTDLKLTREELVEVVSRLPVAVLVGGYAMAKGHKKGGNMHTSHNPTPLTPSHYTRLVHVLERMAVENHTIITGLDVLGQQVDYVLTAGFGSRRYDKLTQKFDGVVYYETDHEIYPGASYRDNTNKTLLDNTLGVWLSIRALSPAITATEQSDYKMFTVGHSTIAKIEFSSVDGLFHGFGNSIHAKTPNLKSSYELHDLFDKHHAPAMGMFQINYDYAMNGIRQAILSREQISLYHCLLMLSSFDRHEIDTYLVDKNVLEVGCITKGAVELLYSLGAVVHTNNPYNADNPIYGDRVLVSTTVERELKIFGQFDSLSDWGSNFSNSDEKFDLVICHGNPVLATSVDEFWTQMHLALHHLNIGGSLVITYYGDHFALFKEDYSVISELNSVELEPRSDLNRQNVFGCFTHWSMFKPAGVNIFTHQWTFIFSTKVHNFGNRVFFGLLIDQFNRHVKHTNAVRTKIAAYSPQTEPIRVPNDLFGFKAKFQFPFMESDVDPTLFHPVPMTVVCDFSKYRLDRPVLQWYNPMKGINIHELSSFDLAGFPLNLVKYSNKMGIKILGQFPRSTPGPSSIRWILVNTTDLGALKHFFRWCVLNVPDSKFSIPIDYKKYVTSILDQYEIKNPFHLEKSFDGPISDHAHSVIMTSRHVVPVNEFYKLGSVHYESGFHVNYDDAEQDCYLQLLCDLTCCDFHVTPYGFDCNGFPHSDLMSLLDDRLSCGSAPFHELLKELAPFEFNAQILKNILCSGRYKRRFGKRFELWSLV